MSGTNTTEAERAGASAPSAAKKTWVTKALGVVFSGTPDDHGSGDGGFVAMQKARLAWDNLRKSIRSQLQQLETAILKEVDTHNKDPDAQDGFDPDAVKAGAKRLYTILDGLDERLIDTLDAGLNAQGADREKHHAAAKAIIKEYQAFVASDSVIGTVDANGFTKTAIRPTVERTLAVLSQSL
jgi:hypothetical protein